MLIHYTLQKITMRHKKWAIITCIHPHVCWRKQFKEENMRGICGKSVGAMLFQWPMLEKEGERDHCSIHIAKMEAIMSVCAKGKVAHESHVRSAWCAHGGTSWWKDDKIIVGENFLLAWNEGRHKTLRLHDCVWSVKVPSWYTRKSSSHISPSQSHLVHLNVFQWILWYVS
jgi:hypothetical protein